MAESTSDLWQLIFFGLAALLIVLQALRGWRLGVVLQTAQLLALAGAYAAAWIGAPHVAPMLEQLGLPHFVLMALGGTGIAIVVFLVISIVSAFLFKKTADHDAGVVRFGYGMGGAFVGMLFGTFLVFAAAIGIRVLGSLAEVDIKASQVRQASVQEEERQRSIPEPSAWMRNIAGIKQSIEKGPAGPVVQQLDPVPGTLYSVMQKLGAMMTNEQHLIRFMNYPGVKPIAEHPKVRALQNDPQIQRDVATQNFLGLLRNPNIVAAANDPEVISLMGKLEFEKALDYALGKPEKPDSAPAR